MADNSKKSSKDLVSAILGKSPAEPSPGAHLPQGADADAMARDLVELYFTLEEPVERDVVFDRLAELQSSVADDFFVAMMVNDEDEFLRGAAAVHLARRGNADAVAFLERELAHPADPLFFRQAVEVLSELRGPAFYDELMAIWQDPERDGTDQREAMVGLEFLDTPRAMADFVAFIEAIDDVHRIPDDEVEVAMAAFVRHGHQAALPVLEHLRQRIVQATWDDPAEGKETAAFIQEGIELLES